MNKTTYTEVGGNNPFDWNAFLDKEEITEKEWEEADKIAESWVTCACGNQCAKIPRNKYTGEPFDSQLSSLGMTFCSNIGSKNKEYAKRTLSQIEKRSVEILTQLEK